MFGRFIKWSTIRFGPDDLPTNIKAVSTTEMRLLIEIRKEQEYSGGGRLEASWNHVSEDQRFYLQPFLLERWPEPCYRCSCVTTFPEMGLRSASIDVGISEFHTLSDIKKDEFFSLLRTLMRAPPDIDPAALPQENG